ncbi:MAG: SUMF1/EgtB/PvdO family nonheme iron enzyme [Deltaproteobacteria bacterium]|nr:SUMF1/EgtB/PvdO family nonheme iron enzyme [Deltaproteobacteria bacterium]
MWRSFWVSTSSLVSLAFVLTRPAGCIVQEHCYEDRDCPGVQQCDPVAEICVYECETNLDCGGDNFTCQGNLCQLVCPEQDDLTCPAGMLSICGAFCIDEHEASRPDATATSAGTDESQATSRVGVIPWFSTTLTPAEAAVACAAAGKRLCTEEEWEAACAGPRDRTYAYGDSYESDTCNSIDAHCEPSCGGYHDCWRECAHDEHILPTGSYAGCVSAFGPFDMSGGVWEAVVSPPGADHYRGGAYNCGDPKLAHQCRYDGVAAGAFPDARGFRCCADGEPS